MPQGRFSPEASREGEGISLKTSIFIKQRISLLLIAAMLISIVAMSSIEMRFLLFSVFMLGLPPFSNLRCGSSVLENARWLSFHLYYMHLQKIIFWPHDKAGLHVIYRFPKETYAAKMSGKKNIHRLFSPLEKIDRRLRL